MYQTTSKSNLEQHRRSGYEGMNYPCGQCDYQATIKGNLDPHRRSVHKGIKYIGG